MSQVGTSDKNFYDRCYFNAHDRTGDVFVITGLGAYANLGRDRRLRHREARRRGAHRALLRRARPRPHAPAGRALPHRGARAAAARPAGVRRRRPRGRLRPHVGGLVPGDRGGAARHQQRLPQHPPELAASRRWVRGAARCASTARRSRSSPSTWLGSRDRSWGIRPVGEPTRPGRTADEPAAAAGSGGSTCRCASTTSRSS